MKNLKKIYSPSVTSKMGLTRKSGVAPFFCHPANIVENEITYRMNRGLTGCWL